MNVFWWGKGAISLVHFPWEKQNYRGRDSRMKGAVVFTDRKNLCWKTPKCVVGLKIPWGLPYGKEGSMSENRILTPKKDQSGRGSIIFGPYRKPCLLPDRSIPPNCMTTFSISSRVTLSKTLTAKNNGILSWTSLVKYVIFTPKRDDEHPRPFYMGAMQRFASSHNASPHKRCVAWRHLKRLQGRLLGVLSQEEN